MGKLVKVENVFKSFGDVNAVNGVSLEIEEGQFYSLLGQKFILWYFFVV